MMDHRHTSAAKPGWACVDLVVCILEVIIGLFLLLRHYAQIVNGLVHKKVKSPLLLGCGPSLPIVHLVEKRSSPE